MCSLVARHHESGLWTRVETRGDVIVACETLGATAADGDELWVAPGLWDLQTNGRWGISFSDPGLKVEQVAAIAEANLALGATTIFPTLITAPLDDLENALRVLARTIEERPELARQVGGIHLEGPWISPLDGYRGAHPREAVRVPVWDDFQRLRAASGGRIAIVTLAPEHPGALGFIARLVDAGVVVAIGHTAADAPTLRAAVAAGATLSTHLGNGIDANLPRHPNAIWNQAADDNLTASFIADGRHLDGAVLRVLARAKGPRRIILVSDASPLAGAATGRYGDWEVERDGRIVVAGTPYLAGANEPLDVGLTNLANATGWSIPDVLATATSNPARLLGVASPRIAPGEPARLVVLRAARSADAGVRLRLASTHVGDRVFTPDAMPAAPSRALTAR